MKINILLPYKEKFDKNKASSVSITVRNNLLHSEYLDQIRIFGQNVETPFFKDNFVGLKYSVLSLKSKNKFLAHEMLKIIKKDSDKKQLIEIHNRPYLIEQISERNRFPISLFFHNDPQAMHGSKSVKDREKILQKCVAVFCVSKYVKQKFLEGILSKKNKVHVLYNGVERKIKTFPKKKKEILFVGRLVSEKGVDLYVDVISKIVKKFPDWTFKLIGSLKLGDDKKKDTFANAIIKKFKNIGDQAKYYGFKNQDFVEDKMKTASIIIIPSIWEEPFGLVAAEAMSNGIAIIASKVGGIPEIVQNNGILLENINITKLEKSVVQLIANEQLRENYQRMAWDNFKHKSSISSKKLDNFRINIFKNYF